MRTASPQLSIGHAVEGIVERFAPTPPIRGTHAGSPKTPPANAAVPDAKILAHASRANKESRHTKGMHIKRSIGDGIISGSRATPRQGVVRGAGAPFAARRVGARRRVMIE